MFSFPKIRRTVLIGTILASALGSSAVPAYATAASHDPAAVSATARGFTARTCGGQHIDSTAPVISTGHIFIRASAATVFTLQTQVNTWTTWRPDVAFATRLQPGPFVAGSSFRWATGGITVVSTVRAVRHDRCTVWGGPASGIDGVHLWTYTTVRGGVLVHTEESWSGSAVDADPAAAQTALDDSLKVWRHDLKRKAEDADSASPSQNGSLQPPINYCHQ